MHRKTKSVFKFKIVYFFFILLFSTSVNAQWLHDLKFINHDKDSARALRFDFENEIASDAATNRFITTYIRDKFIDQELKDNVSAKLATKNKIGSELNGGFYYRSKALHCSYKNQPLSYQWIASIRNRVLFNSSFSKDMFRLYFYGNKIYEGKKADISQFNYSYQQFQQVQLGIMKQVVRGNKTWTSCLTGSYLNGQDYLSVETKRGTLYTAQDAEYIDLDLELTARQSDSASRKFGAINGIGFSVDYGVRLAVKQWKFSLQLNDLGFIAWNKKSSKAAVDTNYHFEGAEIQNVLDSFYVEIKNDQDFKNGFLTKRKYEQFTQTLPAQILLAAETTALHPKIHAYATARYRFNANMVPLILLGGDYLFTKSFYAGISVQYGGYSKLHAGLRTMFDAGKGWTLYAGTNYLDDLFLKNNAGGVGGSFSVQKVF